MIRNCIPGQENEIQYFTETGFGDNILKERYFDEDVKLNAMNNF